MVAAKVRAVGEKIISVPVLALAVEVELCNNSMRWITRSHLTRAHCPKLNELTRRPAAESTQVSRLSSGSSIGCIPTVGHCTVMKEGLAPIISSLGVLNI